MSKGFLEKLRKLWMKNMVIINKGSKDGVLEGDKFLVYASSDEEVKDPDTGKVLGKLVETKGEGEAIIVKENMSYLRSSSRVPPKRSGQLLSLGVFAGTELPPGAIIPFKNPEEKDKVKKIE